MTRPGAASGPNPVPAHEGAARVVVLSRDGCHLCQQAEQVADQVCGPGAWARVDVDRDETLRARYNDHVPVVWVDGRLLTYWTLVQSQLTGALGGADWPRPPDL